MPAQFNPGFRISLLDACVLILGAVGSLIVGSFHLPVGVAIAFIVGHFFLFCNIIRMQRKLELVWAAFFCALVLAAGVWALLSWALVFMASACLTIVFTILTIRHPLYHGVAWSKLNPQLPDRWREKFEAQLEKPSTEK